MCNFMTHSINSFKEQIMKDKVIIITGGSSGIGKAAALDFAKKGAQVLITGRRETALNEVSTLNENIHPLVADSSDPSSAQLIIDTVISKWGKIDVLVNNAGAGANAALEDVSESKISEIIAINLVGPSLLSAASLPYLKKSNGNIINITSAVAHKPMVNLSHYGASKLALEYMTRTWALELAPDIRVNAIAPGPTYSGALTGMMGLSETQASEVEKQEAASLPLARRGTPEEISQWIVWLAQPTNSWVTGQVIGVDGGFGL